MHPWQQFLQARSLRHILKQKIKSIFYFISPFSDFTLAATSSFFISVLSFFTLLSALTTFEETFEAEKSTIRKL